MSGFAGMISLDGAPPDRLLLEKMAARLAFRGPDGTHIRTQPGAGFCFTFLRTGPAPQCPSQPCTLDGRTWLLGDIRLDGRDDVRLKLEQHGEELCVDATDEELVLRVWRRWGEEGIAELIGDYAFALWDAEARQLRCWRDLMGARPFFYAQAGGWFYFSNTLAAIRCAPEISRELDHHFIGDFLLTDWCQYPARTVFRDVARLPAGYRLNYSVKTVDVSRYTSLPIEEPLYLKREEDYVQRFRGLLEDAVLDRLPHGPAAIFMSGGLDSTSIAAVAVRSAKERSLALDLRAFTLDCQPLFPDTEGALASITAQHIGIPIDVKSLASCLPYEGWNNELPPTPEPSNDPFRLKSTKQNRDIANHARVVLIGHGGDGVLTGQTWPYLLDLIKRLQLASLIRTFGGFVLKNKRFPPLRGGFRAGWRRWLRLDDPMADFPRWLNVDFENQMHLCKRWRELRGRTTWQKRHPWHCRAYEMLTSSYCVSLLEGEDAASTGFALEARMPFMDLRVQRFLLRIPPVPLCIDKELLRRATAELVPEQIRSRPKTPLLDDPLVLQVKRTGWSPVPLTESLEKVVDFVNCEKLGNFLRSGKDVSLWRELRPFSLEYWLKRKENELS
jgi:asparagine synthase (glutamine-hydrolysing)